MRLTTRTLTLVLFLFAMLATVAFGQPTITGTTTIAADNSKVTVNFSETVYANPAGYVGTFAGSGTAAVTNGMGTAASFNKPTGVAVDSSGNVYVGDFYNHIIQHSHARPPYTRCRTFRRANVTLCGRIAKDKK